MEQVAERNPGESADGDETAPLNDTVTARRSRRTLTTIVAAAAAVAVLATVGAVTVVRHRRGPAQVRQTGGTSGTAPTMTAGPPGWQYADYGNARLWVPADWQILEPGWSSCPTGAGTLLLGTATIGTSCPKAPVTPAGTVSVAPLTTPPAAGEHTTVKGYDVIASTAQTPDTKTYQVPKLNVAIAVVGSVPDQILATLGPSPRGIVLSDGPIQPPPPNWRTISYHGVRVDTPGEWSVVDGNHAGACEAAFTRPTVFLGPRTIPPIHCGTPPPRPMGPGSDGVWLQPDINTPATTTTLLTPNGQTVTTDIAVDEFRHSLEIWYHHVSVEIGIGSDPLTTRQVLSTLRFTKDAADTVATGTCPPGNGAAGMPHPERLAATLALARGSDTLEPPQPDDRPVIPPEQAWAQIGPTHPGLNYRLILARYSAKAPATLNKDGSLTSLIQHQLAWIVYATPTQSTIGECGLYLLAAYDATTGHPITSASYSPGP